MESWECQAGVTQGTVNKDLHKIFCHGKHLKEDLLVKTLKREIFKAIIGVSSRKVLLGAASSHLKIFLPVFTFQPNVSHCLNDSPGSCLHIPVFGCPFPYWR
jgi:hypothetical protein